MRYDRRMKRLTIAILIGCCAAILCIVLPVNAVPTADLGWPICGARALAAGSDPYDCPRFAIGLFWPTNPLTTVLAVLPFVWLPDWLVAAVLFGVFSGLLAYGLIRDGQYWRLLVFLSASYWQARHFIQWSPLITAASLIPALLPLWLVKPHIGLPVALCGRWTRRTFLVMLLFGLLTFALYPLWPLRWLATVSGYNGFIPLLVLPGSVLLLTLRYWRDRDARILFLMACVPQQLCYDALILFTLPSSPRMLLLLIGCSWLGYIGWLTAGNAAFWTITSIYIPMLLILLTRSLPVSSEVARRRAGQVATSPV